MKHGMLVLLTVEEEHFVLTENGTRWQQDRKRPKTYNSDLQITTLSKQSESENGCPRLWDYQISDKITINHNKSTTLLSGTTFTLSLYLFALIQQCLLCTLYAPYFNIEQQTSAGRRGLKLYRSLLGPVQHIALSPPCERIPGPPYIYIYITNAFYLYNILYIILIY